MILPSLRHLVFLWLAAAFILAGCGATAPSPSLVAPTRVVVVEASPTSAPTHTPTSSPSPTPTPSPTASPTPTITPTPTATPGPTPDGNLRTARVPILMYHYISQPPPDADIYRQDLSVDPETFAAHLDYLKAEGYTTIYLKDLLSHLATGAPDLPAKPVLLTFDDGYEDIYLNAFPALAQRGMTGTFFIITDFATQDRPGYADWPQLSEMAAAGMEIGSHSRDHPNLAGKDLDYLVWQALGSKETIEAHTGAHPRILAYPAGSYDQLVIDVFRSANYWGAVTTQQGVIQRSDKPFELKRVRIRNTTGVEQLATLLQAPWEE
ncbi:MAG: polysaccharide deacetylase family protein [Caldilineales bacterium]|nr:polysaccharide deacetylase family protein [Caldilineales bacterium]